MKRFLKKIRSSHFQINSFKVSNSFNKRLKKEIEAMNRLNCQFAQNMRKSNEILIKQAEEFKRRMVEFKKLEPNITEAHRLLTKMGWYFDHRWILADSLKIFNSFEKGDLEEIDNWLIEYFRENLEEIEIDIMERFPNRKEPLSQAFKAHRRKEYYLSVPVFLAQSDGICDELIGISLYSSKKKKPKIAGKYEKKVKSEFDKSMLIPLMIIGAMGISKAERGEDFCLINRHMILHGESNNYGTEINSLKSISMLNYLVHHLLYKEDSKI